MLYARNRYLIQSGMFYGPLLLYVQTPSDLTLDLTISCFGPKGRSPVTIDPIFLSEEITYKISKFFRRLDSL